MSLPRGACGLRAAGLALVCILAGSALRAQSPDQPSADSLPNARDTVNLSAKFLEGEALAKVRLPVVPRLEADGIQPAGSRIIIDRASLEWATAETVAGLLVDVPGLYLWRSGWVGRPAYASYQGRGATSVEYFLDGLPLLPVGPDSVGVDPALLPLNLLDRVEIERWAGFLRVHLYTPRHDVAAPATSILISTGDRGIRRYGGSLQRRFPSGVGYALAADYWDAPTFSAGESSAQETSALFQLNYLHAKRWGIQYQYVVQSPTRAPYISAAGDSLGEGVKGSRSDVQVRAFLQGGGDGLGRRVDLVFSSTGWSGSDVSQRVNGVGLVASWRRPTLSASASAYVRSRWLRTDVRGEVGWAPSEALSASLEAEWRAYDNSRSSRWLGARAGVGLPMGLSLTGSARVGQVVAAPALAANQAQDISDLSAGVTWQRAWITLGAEASRTSAFQGFAPQPYRIVAGLAATPATTWVTMSGRVAPVPWIVLEGRYGNPTTGTPNGNPPRHMSGTITIRSKFIRTFPSGAFDLKAQVGMESWGAGVLGVDSAAAPILLPAATFFRAYIEMAIGSFRFYYDRTNLAGTLGQYVPGFVMPRYGSTYGVRWSFVN